MPPQSDPTYTALQIPAGSKDLYDWEEESTIKMVKNLKSTARRLANFQTLCLLLIPVITLCLGGVLIVLAVQCDWSGGLRLDRDDGIVCIRVTTDESEEDGESEDSGKGMNTTAIILKISVLVLIIITIGATVTICVWFSMKKWQEKHQRLIAEYAEKYPQLYGHIYSVEKKAKPIYTPPISEVTQLQNPEDTSTTTQLNPEQDALPDVKLPLFNAEEA